MNGKSHISIDQLNQFMLLLERRKKREPVAYILEEQEFWSLPFRVTPDVLIPRPETEFLVESVLTRCRKNNLERGKILDLCCGSGAIAVVLAKETGRRVVALDVSIDALQISAYNIKRHGCEALIDPVCADLLSPFQPCPLFSLIVSNPPYVSDREMAESLQPEVVDYEPHLALDGGCLGLEVIEKIQLHLFRTLMPGGEFFMEFGADQGALIYNLFVSGHAESVFQNVDILKDYAGRDRVLHAVRRA